MKTRSQIALTSLALLLAGTSLLTSTPIVKAEATQDVTNSLQASTQKNHNDLEQAMRDTLQFGAPGILAKTTEGDKTWSYAAGVADLNTKKPMDANFQFRIGSVTKTFISTVVLQLVGENRLNLDDSIEKWLPGVVQGNGYDGNHITIRQLLNHTSGVAEYLRSRNINVLDPTKSYTAEEIVKIGLSFPPDFAPGNDWSYSNTGYVILGILIEKVTGNTYAEEIKERIIKPLELSNTFLPGNSAVIPGDNHAQGYIQIAGLPELLDCTYFNPSIASSSGDMISTADDLNKFFSVLLGGQLLKESQLKEMLTSVPTAKGDTVNRYGLGISETKLKNGVSVWGHTGGIPGFRTLVGGTLGGKHIMTININYMGGAHILDSFDYMLFTEFGN
ncbi:D-alanyl-D-alanine carboxypeptidase [Bacillus toyonensis]|uniref:serine hydrolase domain-containing protein n=1 Tax=Bacillus toyonensis TaxID=155322 RepID=UPI000BF0F6B7|nr:serine hydrolase domain-containing protein [Bacillus toyonensis]PEL01730.1 D-alanyl-D-alanine carboxypeptidase [Bacillus toyonensis]PEO24254.1 D-alanyl-D-alanine carboxypeptidase [Bacillus toyonensis]PFX43775.1 D-alanyl-D-alanine carboxypeptidase [Bacillus toyonensis]PFX96588.1 D-alanyl-D-alanine carboxypeptidase [Bacillus toyonensis]PGB14105.1 D-alanyl-D-alanine carboxypeptidase [Bacillus toyonensis]